MLLVLFCLSRSIIQTDRCYQEMYPPWDGIYNYINVISNARSNVPGSGCFYIIIQLQSIMAFQVE